MCARSCDSVASVLIAVDKNVTQIVVQTELQEPITGACDGETVLGVMIHNQTMRFCAVSEFAVVICSSSTAILDT